MLAQKVFVMYDVRTLVVSATKACPNITSEAFPHLQYIVQSPKAAISFSRISKQSFKRIMIFIARVYYANVLAEKIVPRHGKKNLSFENYPELEEMFKCLELYFQELNQQKRKAASQSPSQLLQSVQAHLSFCQKQLVKVETRLDDAADIMPILQKKIKRFETKIKAKSKPVAPPPAHAPIVSIPSPGFVYEMVEKLFNERAEKEKKEREETERSKKRKRKEKKEKRQSSQSTEPPV